MLKIPPSELAAMCGRTSLFIDPADLETRFDAEIVADGGYTPRYNIAPGDDLHIITNEAPNEIDRYHWGLIPFWADEPEEGIINVRSETADEKSVFDPAWESRPCLVLSSGFYEWQASNGGPKQPYRIHRGDDPAFALAGLWNVREGNDETISCVAIVKTEPNDVLQPIHADAGHPATGCRSDLLAAAPDTPKDLCQPYPKDDLEAYEISTRVKTPPTTSRKLLNRLTTDNQVSASSARANRRR